RGGLRYRSRNERGKVFALCAWLRAPAQTSPLCHPHALDVRELADAVLRKLSPITGPLDAAEREARIGFHDFIHENAADLDLPDQSLRSVQILSPERRA